METPTLTVNCMWLTNAFIIISLLFIWCWDYPGDHPAKKFVQKWGFPFVYMGFWHGWAMFAPEPIHVNRRLRAVLTFADATTEDWSPLGPDSRSKFINLFYARSFKSTGLGGWPLSTRITKWDYDTLLGTISTD